MLGCRILHTCAGVPYPTHLCWDAVSCIPVLGCRILHTCAGVPYPTYLCWGAVSYTPVLGCRILHTCAGVPYPTHLCWGAVSYTPVLGCQMLHTCAWVKRILRLLLLERGNCMALLSPTLQVDREATLPMLEPPMRRETGGRT